jgi:hypothetical protein
LFTLSAQRINLAEAAWRGKQSGRLGGIAVLPLASPQFGYNRLPPPAFGKRNSSGESGGRGTFSMRCPKCQFDHESQVSECLKCGIVFARYLAAQEAKKEGVPLPGAPAPVVSVPVLPPFEHLVDRYDPRSELKCRALAVPVALIAGRWVAGAGMLSLLGGIFAMVVHESGHAITSWLTGRWAIPSFWVTYHGENRQWWIVLAVTAAIGFGGYLAWKAQRWGWVCAAGAVLLLEFIIQGQSSLTQGALIVFGGDGGALVLGTVLIAAFYAPHTSKFYKNWGMRWALLGIGALAFMHVYRNWSTQNIPFGEIEGVNLSDPTLLTEYYGWSYQDMVARYMLLSRVCFAALITIYVWGLVNTYRETLAK